MNPTNATVVAQFSTTYLCVFFRRPRSARLIVLERIYCPIYSAHLLKIHANATFIKLRFYDGNSVDFWLRIRQECGFHNGRFK